ncbi:hypothetical protein GALMADRAFT_148996 [Galerina marginata CBS 339.88]|uniref:BAH domain-containing protein n=1 Tax=Galerina marginata (strain CBS 339.88) TaxID=685588 RepID=A0A067SEA4_GALM3|nr:hypothetical protein GALMADRAFT_148996 [Galerina marginata CBS 339.88]
MDDREFRKLWRSTDAQEVEEYTVVRDQESLCVGVGQSYLFRHPEMKGDPATWTLDQYWKGLIREIRVVPGTKADRPEVLVAVSWFYSKDDIVQRIKEEGMDLEGDPRFEFLRYMAAQEICSSLDNVVNNIESIEYEVDVSILRPKDTLGKPIVEYFSTAAHLYGCSKQGCRKMWNPDEEEQRLCRFCDGWYHVSCLEAVTGTTQKDMTYILKEATKQSCKNAPAILHDFAHQPKAQGGTRHFVAGNSRIVNMCGELLTEDGRTEFMELNNITVEDENWWGALEDYFGLLHEDRGNVNQEQILVENQLVYKCPMCVNNSEVRVVEQSERSEDCGIADELGAKD